MSSVFPGSIDSPRLTNALDATTAPDHAAQHTIDSTAITALETKVGVTASADPTSLDYQVTQLVQENSHITPGDFAASETYVNSLVLSGAPVAAPATMGISRNTKAVDDTIGTVTISVANPAVITKTDHGMTLDDIVQFATSGSLPTGISILTNYYVIAAGFGANSFQISASQFGSAVITTGIQSGTHTLHRMTPIGVSNNNTSSGQKISTVNPAEDDSDTTVATTYTASTISFVAPSTISDSANGFVSAGLRVGAFIAITGSGSNNITVSIKTLAAGSITVNEATVSNEGSGASDTISTVNANKLLRLNGTGKIPTKIMTGNNIAQSADVQIFISVAPGTWTKPTGAKVVEVVCIGAGGGGASGSSHTNNGTNAIGGGGGGGGAVTRAVFNAAILPASVATQVGAGGLGGTAVSGISAGVSGGNGGATNFGTLLIAGGGGGGQGSAAAGTSGGGGSLLNSAVLNVGGAPTVTADAIAGQSPTGLVAGSNSHNAEWGGATGGAGVSAASGKAGGSSIFAGPGGGGGCSSNVGGGVGGAGGTCQAYSVGGGAAAGAPGSTNTVTLKGYCGDGGGGGTTPNGDNQVGGAGGAGGTAGAGGGGGGGSSGSILQQSGVGGVGARGEIRVYSYY